MKLIKKSTALSMAWLIAIQPLLITLPATAQTAPEAMPEAMGELIEKPMPIELTGTYTDRTAQMRAEMATEHDIGYDNEAYSQPALANLPVLDSALSTKLPSLKSDDTLRVILHLDYLPHAEVFAAVTRQHDADMEALESDRQAYMTSQEAKRVFTDSIDANNYAMAEGMTDYERRVLRDLSDRTEVLSTRIKDQVSAQLKTLIDADQAPVIDAVANLGGNVEFATIAGNLVIATIPANRVEELAKIDGVLRVVEDKIMDSHLTNADAATMVDPTDTSLLGLWDNGQDGGAYDPAIIDSGLDLLHPGMKNSATPLRTNFGSWYLVAAVGSAAWNDVVSQEDVQGHGTHVAGIVGSYGTGAYPTSLGMSFGVNKLVNLKAGWRNNTTGGASMFWSDKYNLVNRALYLTGQLQGGSFNDDVDGMNLSYGGSTSLGDTDGGRFWDSVISTYPDLPVTISAGNSGPSNTLFNDPAVSYNAITVANYNDRNTSSLSDDIIASSSTRGPTADSRRKPDIAAPGTSIFAPNNDWETELDYVNKSGTSMAAPMVLGVIMDLADAGLVNHLGVKALLINTAQKNRPGMNIESDADGWDEALGWGVMNAYAAYNHRFDAFVDEVAPRNTAGEYQLYKGVMRDEGASGEGRDRATMVWDRPATYLTSAAPSTYYDLNNLNMRLYQESNNSLLDFDTDSNDNVHQVRIGAGAGDTDVVINAYAWDTVYDNGAATQTYALAVEEGFVRVDRPTLFQGIAQWPSEVEPNEQFEIEFWIRNDSELASHSNTYNLELPVGFTLISGTDTQNVGSIASDGFSTHVNYTIQAPNSSVGAQSIQVKHSHNSYNVPYGDFNWNMGTTVVVDNTPPNPNPMTFSILPDGLSTSQVDMQASFASDIHNPVDYYLDYVDNPSGGTGGSDSGWQASRNYTDNGLTANDEYCYRAWARDDANFPNNTVPSAISCAYTEQSAPPGITFGAVTPTSIFAASQSTPNNVALDSSGLIINNITAGTNSGWNQNNNLWQSAGLTPATKYSFNAQARNGNGDTTALSPPSSVFTLANPPAVDVLSTVSDTEIKVSLNPNGNSTAAEYFIQNSTTGVNSGWISALSWLDDGLTCETFYNYQAKARNGANQETITVPLGLQTTGACGVDTDGDTINDSADNCTLVPNLDQRDTNGDGFGNLCDPDFDGNGIVNFGDISHWVPFFNTANTGDEDLNGDGFANFGDYAILISFFQLPPGPSGVAP